MLILKADCMNCKSKVEYDRTEYKKQIVTCKDCGKKMQIRPYKNGCVTMRNLDI